MIPPPFRTVCIQLFEPYPLMERPLGPRWWLAPFFEGTTRSPDFFLLTKLFFIGEPCLCCFFFCAGDGLEFLTGCFFGPGTFSFFCF